MLQNSGHRPSQAQPNAAHLGDTEAYNSKQVPFADDRGPAKPRGGLRDADWMVVQMARKDGRRSMNPDGLVARLARDIFAFPIARSLANERLEALRRFCVRAWYWDLIRTRDMRALMEAGYSSVDALEVLAHIAGQRGFTPSIEHVTR